MSYNLIIAKAYMKLMSLSVKTFSRHRQVRRMCISRHHLPLIAC